MCFAIPQRSTEYTGNEQPRQAWYRVRQFHHEVRQQLIGFLYLLKKKNARRFFKLKAETPRGVVDDFSRTRRFQNERACWSLCVERNKEEK